MKPRRIASANAAETRPVALRFLSRDLPVELFGDFVHWMQPQLMERLREGDSDANTHRRGDEWETTLHLCPGVYAYKFRTHDGAWHLDPDNPRTRESDGCRNNLLVLAGSDEPVLHVPCFPYAFMRCDGQLVLRAGLRRGHGNALRVRRMPPHTAQLTGLPDGQARDLPMRLCAEEGEHLLFEVRVPLATPSLDYLFVLDSGQRIGSGGQALRVQRTELREKPPEWWPRAVVYTIFVDRFRRSSTAPPSENDLQEHARFGGDLHGVRDALPYLADLGVNVLHLTPVAQSYSAHRYDAVNPKVVDEALGGEAALIALLQEAHRMNMRVLLDVVLTHVHRDFLPFCDVRLHGASSSHAAWFLLDRHPFYEGPDPGYRHYQKGRWQEPLLRTEDEEVAEYLESVIRHYAQLGVDGFRLDAAADVPMSVLRRLRKAAREIKPDSILLGEVTPDNTWRYTAQALDAATDFGHQQVLYDWLWHRRIDARGVAEALSRRGFARGPDSAAVVFTATHDQPRFLTLVEDPRRARLAHLITLLGSAIPAIYYGDEIGLRSDEPSRVFEDAWPDRAPMPWDTAAHDKTTLQLFRKALRLRQSRPALHRGDLQFIDGDLLIIRRRAGEDIVEIFINGDEHERTCNLPPGPSAATLLLSAGETILDGETLRLGPLSAAVIARHVPPQISDAWQTVVEKNSDLCAHAFRTAQLASLSLPTHLYLTVTERCNLACRHCITLAPARTESGQAGTMRPWLIDALSPALAAASYFGFVHGGESLTAAIFFELLSAIQRARAGRPYDIHLLTNGMLLDSAMVERLCALGVTSIAVSLDGGTAETNDGLRVGGSFTRILFNLESAVRLRKRLGLNLRLGVSTVLMQSNVDELLLLGERLSAIGVDWIKVEELYPINVLSRRELLQPRGRRSREAVSALRAQLSATGTTLIDHLAPAMSCPCEAEQTSDSAQQEFRAADDFANRTRFLSCRAAWQQACVDPDGTLHPIDYFQAPLGNLADESFLGLWQGERMQQLRAAALHRIDPRLRTHCSR